MKIFLDTETTGVPKVYGRPVSEVDNYPRLVQLAYIVRDPDGRIVYQHETLIKPVGYEIPAQAAAVHGYNTAMAMEYGHIIEGVLDGLAFWVNRSDLIVGHNISFDLAVLGAEYWRLYDRDFLAGRQSFCTMQSTIAFVGIPRRGGGLKYPKLEELHQKLFDEPMGKAHTALQDITNTMKCYDELARRGFAP